LDGLLHAYALYRAETRAAPWSLVIAGSGAENARLQALARELGLTDVIWPGFVQYDRLPTFYGLASAFVHPAIAEPWGLVVNEAVASGLPVIVSRSVGACGALVADGQNGVVFDPFAARDLADALLRVSRMTDAERARLGQASLAIAARWEPERFGVGLLVAASQPKRGGVLRRAA
jgi:glycosyltransferase involved in cell wall biosynthesis